MNPLKKFFNTPKLVIITSLIVAIGIGYYAYHQNHKAPNYTFVEAKAGTISEQNGTSPKDLTLGFVTGGRIQSVSVKAGDTVKGGQVLATIDAGNATGAVTQARAAYASAQANYQKVINGATGATIDIARAQVNAAQVALSQATDTQATLVANAYRSLLNSTVTAEALEQTALKAPIISGSYTKTVEGSISINVRQAGTDGYFTTTGLTTGVGKVSTVNPQSIGDTGLTILFPTTGDYSGTTWTITLPNKNAPNYLANLNAYQSAQQTQTQVVAQAQATLTAAQATLTAQASAARPEDVAAANAQVESALGTLQIAEANYKNTIISAPGDGTVTTVSITPGQIATPNAPAIELYATILQKDAAVVVPKTAILSKNGKQYVIQNVNGKAIEQEVTIGSSDDTNVEIISGIAAGDMVATH